MGLDNKIGKVTKGLIQKTYAKSFFVRFHYNSPLAKSLLTEIPKYGENRAEVLQIMKIDDGYLLAEVILFKDFIE